MVKWSSSSQRKRDEFKRRVHFEEVEKEQAYRRYLCLIKAVLDLWGEEALTAEELALVEKHRDYFYPKEE